MTVTFQLRQYSPLILIGDSERQDVLRALAEILLVAAAITAAEPEVVDETR